MEQKDNYIGELVEELDAFTPVMSAFSLAFIWTVAAFIIVSLVSLSISSFRHDLLSLNQFIESPRFMLELFTGVGVVFATTLVVFSLSTPGENTRRNITIAFLLISIFASLFLYSFHSPSTHVSMAGKRPFCLYEGLAYGMCLYASLIYLVNKRASISYAKVGMYAGFASCALTAVIMHVGCMYIPTHTLTHHIAPVFIMAIVGVILSKSFVKRI